MIKGCPAWVKYLDKVELPLLSKTLSSICELSDDDVSMSRMVDTVLNDADLTSRVIKIANSAFYNPLQVPTKTMSRAIVQIGFNCVKSIAITSILVDQLAKKSNRHHLTHCLVRSFHAAVQAKYMAEDFEEEEQEAIFVSALLYDVGEAAFWSSGAAQTAMLEERIKVIGGQDSKASEHELLGTTLPAISRGLIKEWKLGALVEESVTKPISRSAKIVRIAVELAHIHDQDNSAEHSERMIEIISALTNNDKRKVSRDLKSNTTKAASLAERFGVKSARNYLNLKRAGRAFSANPQQQLDSLMQVSEWISRDVSIDKVQWLILEGLHKSVGLERCAIFLFSPEHKQYFIYKSIGDPQQSWCPKKGLTLSEDHPIQLALNQKVSRQLRVNQHRGDTKFAPYETLIPSLVGPLLNQGICYGFVYADRLDTNAITDGQLKAFRLFVQQAEACFSHQYQLIA